MRILRGLQKFDSHYKAEKILRENCRGGIL